MNFQPLLNTHHDDRGQDVCEKVFESPGLQNSRSSLTKHPLYRSVPNRGLIIVFFV